jgi:hypothetical protein
MSLNEIAQKDRERLQQFLAIAHQSNHQGEQLAALAKAIELMSGHKLNLGDLVAQAFAGGHDREQAAWRRGRQYGRDQARQEQEQEQARNRERTAADRAQRALAHRYATSCLTVWEVQFLESMKAWRGRPAEKQQAVLERIETMLKEQR